MERDEVYVPKTRSDLGVPEEHDHDHGKFDYDEYFGDTPIYTLYMLLRQQLFAFPAYLRKSIEIIFRSRPTELIAVTVVNVSGQKRYPKWTSHFDREYLVSPSPLSPRTQL